MFVRNWTSVSTPLHLNPCCSTAPWRTDLHPSHWSCALCLFIPGKVQNIHYNLVDKINLLGHTVRHKWIVRWWSFIKFIFIFGWLVFVVVVFVVGSGGGFLFVLFSFVVLFVCFLNRNIICLGSLRCLNTGIKSGLITEATGFSVHSSDPSGKLLCEVIRYLDRDLLMCASKGTRSPTLAPDTHIPEREADA